MDLVSISGRGPDRCDADDQTVEVCARIKEELEKDGYRSEIVPYSGKRCLQFRFVAESAGVGQFGKSAFLLHPIWGPWVHLRVLATTSPKEIASAPQVKKTREDLCLGCTRCITSCPAGAFTSVFNGRMCRSHREEKGEYIPSGKERTYNYCLICALVCPIGERPERVRSE